MLGFGGVAGAAVRNRRRIRLSIMFRYLMQIGYGCECDSVFRGQFQSVFAKCEFTTRPREPPHTHRHRHGPDGYRIYESYRSWLCDEFCFRCAYCLNRELWTLRLGGWHLDHFAAQAIQPEARLDYDNLVYTCSSCNLLKGKRPLPDPSHIAYSQCPRMGDDGSIHALNNDGKRLILTLRLNDEERTGWRRKLIKTLRILAKQDYSTFREWMGFPDDLPDLRRQKPEHNSRPEGVERCYFVQQERGTLPEVY